MTRKDAMQTTAMLNRLISLGISSSDADKLRRISMTLHSWHEAECGRDNGCIERDEETGRTFWLNAISGKRYPTPDRETGALARLGKIMAQYPTLTTYVQGDPRGCALYILRPGDVPAGADVSSYYSRGIAVHR